VLAVGKETKKTS